jgi:hypothetical protein
MATSRNNRQSLDGRVAKGLLLEALDDLRNAARLLKATESKLSARIHQTPRGKAPKRPGKR